MTQNPNADLMTQAQAATQAAAGDQVQEVRKTRDPVTSKMTLSLTSMIDVIFQLQIYFLLTAAFTLGEGVITANLPVGDGATASADELNRTLNIQVSPAGSSRSGFRINIEGMSRAPASFTDLANMLTEMRKGPENPGGIYDPKQTPVLIKPEGDVRWQHVVNAFNAAVKAKYANVAFAAAGVGEGN